MTDFLVTRRYRVKRVQSGAKPNEDFASICEQEYGFITLPFLQVHNRLLSLLYAVWWVWTVRISARDRVWIQYPLYSRLAVRLLLDKCDRVKVPVVFVIHDIEYMREYPERKDQELTFFKRAQALVVHNERMAARLRADGLTAPLVPLGIFDYLDAGPYCERLSLVSPIMFAGDFYVTNFVSRLPKDFRLNAYGQTRDTYFPDGVAYQGAFPPEELNQHLEGSFGLVWAGDSTETCTGPAGEYLRVNNPYKLSAYIAAGIPVIIWQEAAEAEFVRSHGIGFAVSSLSEVYPQIERLSQAEYAQMSQAARELAKDLREGAYTEQAISAVRRELGLIVNGDGRVVGGAEEQGQ